MNFPGWKNSEQSEDDLDQLVERAQANDRQAIEELLGRISPLLYKVARSVVRSDSVEDVVQDVRVYLLERIGQYEPTGHFLGWVAVIARHAAIDSIRRDRTRLSRHIPLKDDENPTAFEEVIAAPQADFDPDARLALQDILMRLSPREREMVIMHYLSGYSYREIAQIKNLSVKTVGNLLGRARYKIRDYLSR